MDMKLNSLSRQALSLAAINGFFVVAIGAFGAHLLEQKIPAELMSVFETGVQYHMFHVLALLSTGLLAAIKEDGVWLNWCLRLFMAGIILFCGSLYVLALTGISRLGMITPLGGVCFLAGWGLMFYFIVIKKEFTSHE